MISDTQPPRQQRAPVSVQPETQGSYVDWAAILAGGIFALAISFLLISFGASLGLSLASPFQGEGVSVAWLAIAAGIWFAWVMVTGFGAGGYIAGRMRRNAGDATADEVEVRDGTHGLMVWATGALVGAVLAAAGVGGFVSAGSSAAGAVTEAATEAVSSDYFANVMLRGSETGAAANAGIDADVQQEVAGILARSVASGEVVERDRSYLAQLVAANSDLDQEAARARVEGVTTEIDEARETALEAVEKARVAGVVFGFIAAATLLIGAVAAFFAATAGGRHRDEGVGWTF